MVERLEKVVAQALKYVDGDNYLLAVLVSKRAEELSQNGIGTSFLSKEFIRSKSLTRNTDIALYELAERKVAFTIS
jgi:DNA-directed RNA polymerase subunit K/omega